MTQRTQSVAHPACPQSRESNEVKLGRIRTIARYLHSLSIDLEQSRGVPRVSGVSASLLRAERARRARFNHAWHRDFGAGIIAASLLDLARLVEKTLEELRHREVLDVRLSAGRATNEAVLPLARARREVAL